MSEVPEPYKPSPYLSDDINNNIAQSEIDGGAHLRDLDVGSTLKVQTKNTTYLLKRVQFGPAGFEISGHQKFCPTPTSAYVPGSTWGGSLIKMDFLGRGMHMEFHTEKEGRVVTSPIQEIEELPA